jgi:multicomponent K+:H+ antiporter subunit D
MARAGARRFWVAQERSIPRVQLAEMLPVVALIGLTAILAGGAGEAIRYLDAAAEALHTPQPYVDRVLIHD